MSTMMGASSKCAMTTIIVMMYVNVPSARRYEGERERKETHSKRREKDVDQDERRREGRQIEKKLKICETTPRRDGTEVYHLTDERESHSMNSIVL